MNIHIYMEIFYLLLLMSIPEILEKMIPFDEFRSKLMKITVYCVGLMK